MKIAYTNPEVEIVLVANEDVLTLSNTISKGTPDSYGWGDLPTENA